MARYRFNKKVRSNKRDENKKLDTRKYKLAITYWLSAKRKRVIRKKYVK